MAAYHTFGFCMIISVSQNEILICCILVPSPDHEEEFRYSGSEEEDEQLLAGMIAEEMGWELAPCLCISDLKV